MAGGLLPVNLPGAGVGTISDMTEAVAPGRLLVATPGLLDPNFARGVVLVVTHDAAGTMGVILNRPTDVDARQPLPAWADLVGSPDRVFLGGPVRPEVAIGMAHVDRRVDHPAWVPVTESVGLLDLGFEPEEYGPTISEVRIFSGYSGWAEGQLEAELLEPSWFVIDGLAGDTFTRRPGALWREVLRRQSGELALYSTYPPDPSAN